MVPVDLALAGLDPEAKNAILESLWQRLRPGAVLLVRSVAGLRRLQTRFAGTL